MGLRYALAAKEVIDPEKKSRLEFWIRAENPNIPSWQDENPIVTLYGPSGTTCRLRPKAGLLHSAEHPESRQGWLLIRVPLAGDAIWAVEGPLPKVVEKIVLGFDSWGAKPFRIWLDGMRSE